MGLWYGQDSLPRAQHAPGRVWAHDHLLPRPLQNAPGAWGGSREKSLCWTQSLPCWSKSKLQLATASSRDNHIMIQRCDVTSSSHTSSCLNHVEFRRYSSHLLTILLAVCSSIAVLSPRSWERLQCWTWCRSCPTFRQCSARCLPGRGFRGRGGARMVVMVLTHVDPCWPMLTHVDPCWPSWWRDWNLKLNNYLWETESWWGLTAMIAVLQQRSHDSHEILKSLEFCASFTSYTLRLCRFRFESPQRRQQWLVHHHPRANSSQGLDTSCR